MSSMFCHQLIDLPNKVGEKNHVGHTLIALLNQFFIKKKQNITSSKEGKKIKNIIFFFF